MNTTRGSSGPLTLVAFLSCLLPGTVFPHLTEGHSMRHISVGEPLGAFAKVEIGGRPGPRQANLVRMRSARRHLDEGLELAEGTSQAEFEKKFGKGTKLEGRSVRYASTKKKPSDPLFGTTGRLLFLLNGACSNSDRMR